MRRVTVTQVRSSIGTKPKHRATLRALGLRGIGQSNTLPDRPEIRGMIARVPHLIRVTVPEGDRSTKTPPTASPPAPAPAAQPPASSPAAQPPASSPAAESTPAEPVPAKTARAEPGPAETAPDEAAPASSGGITPRKASEEEEEIQP
ncbi:MAG: 50S ribosomal protein L30 [Actinomycetota bacterium]|nr:50S ribosomal protein L30 [Actinomycetota bacterium]